MIAVGVPRVEDAARSSPANVPSSGIRQNSVAVKNAGDPNYGEFGYGRHGRAAVLFAVQPATAVVALIGAAEAVAPRGDLVVEPLPDS